MFSFFSRNTDSITIECPSCRTKKSIQKSSIENFETRKFIRCRCTCGSSFSKRININDPSEIDLISAMISLDFGTIWYKIQHPLAFLN